MFYSVPGGRPAGEPQVGSRSVDVMSMTEGGADPGARVGGGAPVRPGALRRLDVAPTVEDLLADAQRRDMVVASDPSGTGLRIPDGLAELGPSSVVPTKGRYSFSVLHPNDRLLAARGFIATAVERVGSHHGIVRVMEPDGAHCRLHELLIADLLDDPRVGAAIIRFRPVPGAPLEPVVVDTQPIGWQRPSATVVFTLDGTGSITDVTGPLDELLGWNAEHLVGTHSLTIIHPDDHAAAANAFVELHALSEVGMLLRHRLLRADGSYRWIEATLTAVDETGSVQSACHDIAEQVELEERLDFQANHDLLTGLLNRSSILAELEQLAAPGGPTDVAVLFIDLDDFKDVNDTLGHDVGDELLRRLARRFEAELRPQDALARLGGDEFLVICRVASEEDALEVARRLVAAAGSNETIEGSEVRCTASVGIARQRVDAPQRAKDLIRDADTAMYEAKRKGRDQTAVFDESLRTRLRDRFRRQNDLRAALEHDDGLEVWYHQVRFASQPDVVIGVEALVRWRLPSGEVLSPTHFLPAAAGARLMPQVDRWTLRRAMKEFGEVLGHPNLPEGFRLGINLSGDTLNEAGAVSRMLDDVAAAGFDPAHLVVEITETELIHNLDAVVATMTRFQAAGTLVALDDFGIGYSSISHLRRIPADFLKLDHTFVADLGHDPQVEIILESIVTMADRLGLVVIAEGIETDAQLRAASDLGVTTVQGHLWGPPCPAEMLPFWPEAGA